MDAQRSLESLAERLRSSASVETLYGEPVEAQGKTIIPVARITYGLGGGYGKAKTYDQEGRKEERPAGESGGGGIIAVPVGVVEVSRERTRFVPLRSKKAAWAGTFLAGFVLGTLLGKKYSIRGWTGRLPG